MPLFSFAGSCLAVSFQLCTEGSNTALMCSQHWFWIPCVWQLTFSDQKEPLLRRFSVLETIRLCCLRSGSSLQGWMPQSHRHPVLRQQRYLSCAVATRPLQRSILACWTTGRCSRYPPLASVPELESHECNDRIDVLRATKYGKP